MGENWMAMLESIISDSPRIDINEMVDKYLQYERERELTEEEIHAERSERFIKNGHIVCNPFGDYNEGPDYTDHDDELLDLDGFDREMEYGEDGMSADDVYYRSYNSYGDI